MSALAPRVAHVLAAERASLKRPRGTGAAAHMACGKMKFAHRVIGANSSAQIVPSVEEAAKRRKTSSPSKPAATQAAHQRTEPAAKKQKPLPDQPQRPMASLIDKAMEVMKRRRRDETAIAREKFRQELLEVEKAAIPDETIYPEDLAELGLTELQYAVTPTRKQALRSSAR